MRVFILIATILALAMALLNYILTHSAGYGELVGKLGEVIR